MVLFTLTLRRPESCGRRIEAEGPAVIVAVIEGAKTVQSVKVAPSSLTCMMTSIERRRRLLGIGIVLLGWAPVRAEPVSPFTGAAVCARCHDEIHREWLGARHGKMLQPATLESVKGAFHVGPVILRGTPFRFLVKNDVYSIVDATPGNERKYRVDYTLGSRRIQHYLTTLPGGRIIVLAPSWDVLRKQWFHNMEIVNPEEADGSLVQVWNKNCYSCHVSREQKNFDPLRNTYQTRWQDFGTNCERCHGPGGEHVARHEQPGAKGNGAEAIVIPTRLDASRGTMVCAQCHSLRNIVAEGYRPGETYYDFFLPILEYGQKMDGDPAYWPDGRTRRFSNDAIGFWQSECFLQGGATCMNCHADVHDPEVEKNTAISTGTNGVCITCHQAIGQSLEAHSHHRVSSAGSSCFECHMPRTVYSIKAEIRDHAISIPVPENTIRHGIPNACNLCHKDQDAKWTARIMNGWYGTRSRQKLIRRATAFSSARKGDRASIDPLLAILGEKSEGAIARANATGHLSRFGDDPRVFAAMNRALTDPEPLVRAVAALRIESKSETGTLARGLTQALGDPVRAVRVGAVLSLVNLGIPRPFGKDGERFERAVKEYVARVEIHSDDASEQFNVGMFELLGGGPAAAVQAFETSARLDSRLPVRYFQACAYLEIGQVDQAIRILRTISSRDARYEAAQRLLSSLTSKEAPAAH
jgi:hypothetical protein